MVEGEIKEYAIKDETTVETVEVKRNYLSVLATHYLQTTLSTERACKDIL
jgi:predicted thioesterase